MTTATGTYATTATVKARLGIADTDTDDDDLLDTICDQVNQFIESPQGCGRIVAPVASATYVADGNGLTRLYVPRGIRTLSALSLGDFTGDDLDLLDPGDYLLRPTTHDRTPGWPAEWIVLSDRATGSHSRFAAGFGTVSYTATTGWDAIPDDLVDAALTTAVRAWHARQSGQADVVGSDETGAPVVSRYVAPFHWTTIRAYRVKQPAVIGTNR